MSLVGTALNLQEKMKIYPQVVTFFIKPQIWMFHVLVLQTTAKKWTKVKNTRAGSLRSKRFRAVSEQRPREKWRE